MPIRSYLPFDGAGEGGISLWLGFFERWADPVVEELPNHRFVLSDAKPGGYCIGTHGSINCAVDVSFLQR